METWKVWKPGLTEPAIHGVVLAITDTAPPLAAGGSIEVKGHNPATIGSVSYTHLTLPTKA